MHAEENNNAMNKQSVGVVAVGDGGAMVTARISVKPCNTESGIAKLVLLAQSTTGYRNIIA